MALKAQLVGQKFNRLLVIGEDLPHKSPDGTQRAKWKCLCDCGKISSVTTTELRSGHTKSCGCWSAESAKKLMTGNKYFKKRRKGTKNIRTTYFNRLRREAERRNFEFLITIDYIQDLLDKQNFTCALTGDKLIMDFNTSPFLIAKGEATHNTASLDRIDSTKGYIEGNVQWVHKRVNWLKQDMQESELLDWCSKVVEHHKKKLESTSKAL